MMVVEIVEEEVRRPGGKRHRNSGSSVDLRSFVVVIIGVVMARREVWEGDGTEERAVKRLAIVAVRPRVSGVTNGFVGGAFLYGCSCVGRA